MTIVALDDNQHTLALIRSVLRTLGVVRVRCYLRPESAQAAIEAAPPEIVITDWELGPTSGLHFARTLRRSGNARVASLPIVMLTAHADATLVRAARDAGIDSYVVKPFSAAVLAQHIAAARRRAQGPAVAAMPGRAGPKSWLPKPGLPNCGGVSKARSARSSPTSGRCARRSARIRPRAGGPAAWRTTSRARAPVSPIRC